MRSLKSADFVFKAKSADFVLKTKSARAAPFLASGGLVGSRLPSRRRPARLWRAGLAKLGSRWRGLGRFPGVGLIGRGQAVLEGGEGALRLCALKKVLACARGTAGLRRFFFAVGPLDVGPLGRVPILDSTIRLVAPLWRVFL